MPEKATRSMPATAHTAASARSVLRRSELEVDFMCLTPFGCRVRAEWVSTRVPWSGGRRRAKTLHRHNDGVARPQRDRIVRCATAPWRECAPAAGIVFAPKMDAMNDRPQHRLAPRRRAALDRPRRRSAGRGARRRRRALAGPGVRAQRTGGDRVGVALPRGVVRRARIPGRLAARAAPARARRLGRGAAPGRGARSGPAEPRAEREAGGARTARRQHLARGAQPARDPAHDRPEPGGGRAAAATTCAARARSCATRSIGWDG